MGEHLVTNWYHCPKCDKPVDPVWDAEGGDLSGPLLTCPDCGVEVEVRHE